MNESSYPRSFKPGEPKVAIARKEPADMFRVPPGGWVESLEIRLNGTGVNGGFAHMDASKELRMFIRVEYDGQVVNLDGVIVHSRAAVP